MPCCIDRMRFSPRFSIRKLKELYVLFPFTFFFLLGLGPVWHISGPGDGAPWGALGLGGLQGFAAETEIRPTGGLGAAGPSAGGSSAVEQRTVKCASAAILWSGVQISLSGIFFFCFLENQQNPFQSGILRVCTALVIRSYHGESTASHPNCEVKHRWAGSVLW